MEVGSLQAHSLLFKSKSLLFRLTQFPHLLPISPPHLQLPVLQQGSRFTCFSFPSVTALGSSPLLFSSQGLYPSLGLLYLTKGMTTAYIAFFFKKFFFSFGSQTVGVSRSTTYCRARDKLFNLSKSVSSPLETYQGCCED